MEIVLPKTRSKAENYLPQFMIIYSKPKVGKSTVCAALPNALIIDLEDGYRALPVMKVQARSFEHLKAIRKAIVEEGRETKQKPYKYIVIDNATRLEEYCISEATRRHRAEEPTWGILHDEYGRGLKNEKGEFIPDPNANVLNLGYGKGYTLLRDTVKNVIDMFKPVCECLILVSHTKESSININTEEMSEISPDIAGKLSTILCGVADAIGFMYRKGNDTFMTFKGGGNVINEARPKHLTNKTFRVITSSDDDTTPQVNIKEIFGEQDDTVNLD